MLSDRFFRAVLPAAVSVAVAVLAVAVVRGRRGPRVVEFVDVRLDLFVAVAVAPCWKEKKMVFYKKGFALNHILPSVDRTCHEASFHFLYLLTSTCREQSLAAPTNPLAGHQSESFAMSPSKENHK